MTKNVTIFIFPFAGGSQYAFTKITDLASDQVNVVVLELPGRGKRIHEKLLTSFDDIVDNLFGILTRTVVEGPFVFFGHSLGALVAFELCRKLRDSGLTLPSQLVVSGRGGPSHPYFVEPLHSLPSPEFRSHLMSLGMLFSEVLADENLAKYVEPILRADLKALYFYHYYEAAALPIPIVVLNGERDTAAVKAAEEWKKETSSTISCQTFEGGHFFIFDHIEAIMKILSNAVEPESIDQLPTIDR